MARQVGNHSGGAYDTSAQQDIIDCDAFQGPLTVLSGTADVINAHVSGNYVINTGSADAMTLGAPTAGTDDNLSIVIYSNTAFAHTLTATGLLQTGQSGKTGVLTFAAFAGCGCTLRAFNGKWQVLGSQSMTYTS
jgi:hypothetical protein